MAENFHARSARRAGLRHDAGARRLAADVPDLIVSYDEIVGVPNQITTRARGARLTRAAASPEDAATGFVRDRADLWRLDGEDADTVDVRSVSLRGTRTVRLIQRVGGVEVFNSDVTVAMTRDNEVIAVAGQLFAGAGRAQAQARGLSDVDPVDAIATAASDLLGDALDTAELDRPVRVRPVLYPFGDNRFDAGWYIELWYAGHAPHSYVVSTDGSVLYRKNLRSQAAFTYLVHNTGDPLLRPHDSPAPGTPHPTGQADGFQAATVPEIAVTVESLIGAPWLADDATTTSGNNCIAYADTTTPDGQNSGDAFGTVTSTRRFGQTYDHASSATSAGNVQNGVVGMFFHVNWLHDRWYAAGFDEAAGNAQQDNFGRGGEDGDPILAEANDWSGVDNANMDTGEDGTSPRMQMYVFPGPSPDRASAHEALVTFHEMGHYISNRLVGNANGLDNVQGRAMGEGWGDFFAICMTSQPSDDFTGGAFGGAGWCAFKYRDPDFRDNYFFGIRRYPYSNLFSLNPLTFQHISKGEDLPSSPPPSPNDSGPNEEFHHAGEIWCSAVWGAFVRLVLRHGHTQAERRMLRYVIGGLELTPNQPTFLQARDAIISVVTAIDPTDLRQVWGGFAGRGMGLLAVGPPSDSTNLKDIIEDFSIPPGLPFGHVVAEVVAIDQLL